jgi:hypothetical protein
MSTTQASAILRFLTKDLVYLWTIALYRQAVIAIAKRYITELIRYIDFYNPLNAADPIRILAAGVGYHPRTLLGAYTINKALLSRLQPELLEMYSRLSTVWQRWNWQYYQDYCVQSSPGLLVQGVKRGLPSEGNIDIARSKRVALPAQTPVLPSPTSGFIYNTEYKVIICISCKLVLRLSKAI